MRPLLNAYARSSNSYRELVTLGLGLGAALCLCACTSVEQPSGGQAGDSASAGSASTVGENSGGAGGEPPIVYPEHCPEDALEDAGAPKAYNTTTQTWVGYCEAFCYIPEDSALLAKSGGQPLCLGKYPEPDCNNGWCEVPAGSAILGEDPELWTTSVAGLTQVGFSHDILVQQHETTREEWKQVFPNDPSTVVQVPERELLGAYSFGSCDEGSCPVGHISALEAMRYANQRSLKEGLPPCYVFYEGQGEVGKEGYSARILFRYQKLSQCPGYRLPSRAEQQRYARAGFRGDGYGGNFVAPQYDLQIPWKEQGCVTRDRALEKIAWYCGNTPDLRTRPVGLLLPNAYGLYDTLGNAREYTGDADVSGVYPEGMVDPERLVRSEYSDITGREARVTVLHSSVTKEPLFMTACFQLGVESYDYQSGLGGIRLVRTVSWEKDKPAEVLLHNGDGVEMTTLPEGWFY